MTVKWGKSGRNSAPEGTGSKAKLLVPDTKSPCPAQPRPLPALLPKASWAQPDESVVRALSE